MAGRNLGSSKCLLTHGAYLRPARNSRVEDLKNGRRWLGGPQDSSAARCRERDRRIGQHRVRPCTCSKLPPT